MTNTLSAFHTYQQMEGAVFALENGVETVAHYGDSAAEYQAALTGAGLFDAGAAGRIWMRDRDRASLLHRLSTNQIEALQPGQGVQTVLTNHNGRIIDLLTVHALPDQLLLVTSPQQGEAVLNLLRKNIFFNDKVKLEQASETMGQILLFGPHSPALLAELSVVAVADLQLHHILAAEIDGVSLWIARIKPLGGAGFVLYVPAEAMVGVWTALRGAGAMPIGQAAYDILRVEAGYGGYGRELSLEYIPLETGLWEAISFTKGCYVGQEIIARMESRNRLAKLLRGLKLAMKDRGLESGSESASLQSLISELQLPAKLDVGGKEAGDLTSVVNSPRFGWIGLAYVRSAHAAPGATVGVAGHDLVGEVIELPF